MCIYNLIHIYVYTGVSTFTVVSTHMCVCTYVRLAHTLSSPVIAQLPASVYHAYILEKYELIVFIFFYYHTRWVGKNWQIVKLTSALCTSLTPWPKAKFSGNKNTCLIFNFNRHPHWWSPRGGAWRFCRSWQRIPCSWPSTPGQRMLSGWWCLDGERDRPWPQSTARRRSPVSRRLLYGTPWSDLRVPHEEVQTPPLVYFAGQPFSSTQRKQTFVCKVN